MKDDKIQGEFKLPPAVQASAARMRQQLVSAERIARDEATVRVQSFNHWLTVPLTPAQSDELIARFTVLFMAGYHKGAIDAIDRVQVYITNTSREPRRT